MHGVSVDSIIVVSIIIDIIYMDGWFYYGSYYTDIISIGLYNI